jgi:alanyl-tRNA synthetase
MKLATSGATTSARDLVEVKGAQVWTPRFEGLDKKAHAAVVDEFRNRNKDRAFVLLSSAIEGDGVHVISAVSSGLTDRVKAPEIMKRLGLRGGGRPDFAPGRGRHSRGRGRSPRKGRGGAEPDAGGTRCGLISPL